MNSPETGQGYWERNGTELSSDGRVTVTNDPMDAGPFQTTVLLNSTAFVDAGTYNCSASVTPQNSTFVVGSFASVTRIITVLSNKRY